MLKTALLTLATTAALATATGVTAAQMLTGTYTDHGSFKTIQLDNGEMLDVTESAQVGDTIYGYVEVDGVSYTIYDGGHGIGPIYAVPSDGV